jgi:hypothetical protein
MNGRGDLREGRKRLARGKFERCGADKPRDLKVFGPDHRLTRVWEQGSE